MDMKLLNSVQSTKWYLAQNRTDAGKTCIVACVVDGAAVEVARFEALEAASDSSVAGLVFAAYIAKLHNDALASGEATHAGDCYLHAEPWPEHEVTK